MKLTSDNLIIIIIIIIKYLFASKTYSITSMVFYYLFKVPNSRLERKIKIDKIRVMDSRSSHVGLTLGLHWGVKPCKVDPMLGWLGF